MTKADKYLASLREIEVRLEKGGDLTADLGNIAAILKKRLDFFWIGFYYVRGDRLVLGPFQGTPACVFLPAGEGVCGTCAAKRETIIVPDVHAFPGHIACDAGSRSEIVVPLFDEGGVLRGVLDVDSDKPDMFDDVDRVNLEAVASRIKPFWSSE
jgi:GAF domain-containing protein